MSDFKKFKECTGYGYTAWANKWGKTKAFIINSWRRGYSRLDPNSDKSHPLYYTYKGMLERCYSPHCQNFEHYGGRGIYVCARWFYSFSNFLEDMGPKPDKTYQIDRSDNNGPYSPSNCNWVTCSDNQKNRRYLGRVSYIRFVTPIGEFKTLKDVAKKYNRSIPTVCGWCGDDPRLSKKGFYKYNTRHHK